jgi:peroxiredoxin
MTRLLVFLALPLAGAVFFISPAISNAAEYELPTSPGSPGVQVGEKAPAFTLESSTGQFVSLESLIAKGTTVLVFYRSADWCPFCQAQMREIQSKISQIEASGFQFVAICYDEPAILRTVAARMGLTFPLLSDAGSRTIDAYGIRNHEATGRADGIPHPATFVLDRAGTIRAKLMHDTPQTRPPVEEFLEAAAAVDRG